MRSGGWIRRCPRRHAGGRSPLRIRSGSWRPTTAPRRVRRARSYGGGGWFSATTPTGGRGGGGGAASWGGGVFFPGHVAAGGGAGAVGAGGGGEPARGRPPSDPRD